MGKKLPYTPSSRIRSALRALWMRCRERQAAIKRECNTCQHCHRKGSTAKGREVKIHVHHKRGIDWERLFAVIRECLLQTADDYEVLCTECHAKHHQENTRE